MRLLAFVGPLKCVCRVVTAFFLLASLIFPAAAESPELQAGEASAFRAFKVWTMWRWVHARPAREVRLRNPPGKGNLHQWQPNFSGPA